MNLFELLFRRSCLFHDLTGLYCPGCGGTRAVYFLLTGHPLLSLWYHPLVIWGLFMIIYYLTFLMRGKINQARQWPLWGCLVVLAANFVIKNFMVLVFHTDPMPYVL